jgi:phosphoribosylformylglycinamidine synthase
VEGIFAKWDLPCAKIGRVTDDGMMRVLNGGTVVAEIPARKLADEAPLYDREAIPPPPAPLLDTAALETVPVESALLQLLGHPSIASKNWVYRQYDHMVRNGARVAPGSDAAVFIVREAGKILAGTTDCNSLYCALDPREGGRIAVAEAARNLACSGARGLAVTDNLNFGNPHRPENFWALREAVEGLAEACRVFETPVTGGNVSLYNESQLGPIDPTPTVSMIGIIDSPQHVTTQAFKETGDVIVLFGGIGTELGASHFLKVCHGKKMGPVPRLDFEREKALHALLLLAIRAGWIRSAHDCSEGGLAVALAEACISGATRLGADVTLSAPGERSDVVLFNESQTRVVASLAEEHLAALQNLAAGYPGVGFQVIGVVTEESAPLNITVNEKRHSWSITELHHSWWNSIGEAMSR